MKVSNVVKHFILITRHKWVVFKLTCRIGIPWRGLVHDLSKYSPTEFWEGAKYFAGTHSPIAEAKRTNGYSKAWLHHKGRNKHHPEYWVDDRAPEKTPVIPYKYAAEMICDKVAAGMTYQGKNFTKEYELKYFREKEKGITKINPKVEQYIDEVLVQIAENGVNKTLTKSNIKSIYKKYCE
ncbi:MAG: catalase [Clostridia bacterium]|nr:catalase [Clostridia bacterium]